MLRLIIAYNLNRRKWPYVTQGAALVAIGKYRHYGHANSRTIMRWMVNSLVQFAIFL